VHDSLIVLVLREYLLGPVHVRDESHGVADVEPEFVETSEIARVEVVDDDLRHRPPLLLGSVHVAPAMRKAGISIPDDLFEWLEEYRVDVDDAGTSVRSRSEVMVELAEIGRVVVEQCEAAPFEVSDPEAVARQALVDWRRREEQRD